MLTFKLTFVVDGYLIEIREIRARNLKSAKTKVRSLCHGRKVTNIREE